MKERHLSVDQMLWEEQAEASTEQSASQKHCQAQDSFMLMDNARGSRVGGSVLQCKFFLQIRVANAKKGRKDCKAWREMDLKV